MASRPPSRSAPADAPARSTRDRLLEAAIRVFARNGYYGTTVDGIVAESGTSKGAFYFYFPSKEALFASLVEGFASAMIQDIQKAVESTSGAQARVQAALAAGMRAFSSQPDLARVFLVEAVGVNPELERRRRELYDRFSDLIRGYLEMAVAEGDIPPADTALVARAILGAIHEVVVYHLTTPGAPPLEQAIPGLARFILRGAGWQLPP